MYLGDNHYYITLITLKYFLFYLGCKVPELAFFAKQSPGYWHRQHSGRRFLHAIRKSFQPRYFHIVSFKHLIMQKEITNV